MIGKLKRVVNLVGNMGWRYTRYRAWYELMRRSGSFKKKFPAAPPYKQYLTLREWENTNAKFFFTDKTALQFDVVNGAAIKETFDNIRAGKLLLFNSISANLGVDYDWITNPDTGFKYDVRKHWTEIADLSKEAGDIKFVWEKSRFSYLYDIMRYDLHFHEDCSEMVFRDIISWIDGNPVNCGPNYRCSQEMSLRVLNWTFALYYYKGSAALTEAVFNKMQYAIYWHMQHIYNNIDFSRIAVRNNHAITETLALYLAGMFYPALPGAAEWKRKGKAWFEEEIVYQVYEDGTYLQFSMNYHRIVVQLLTWAIVLAEKNDERLSEVVYERAHKSVLFLRTCMVDANGWLPNYGANDGALFFNLSGAHYRDYRPQLHALSVALGRNAGFSALCEDVGWYGLMDKKTEPLAVADGCNEFGAGGYYVIREPETLTFIKCGGYKDRPSHADNLHLDIWYKGENLLPDAGSYKYNTDEATIRYFSGTASHNTVMLGDKDQMLKGGRFIWYYWADNSSARIEEVNGSFVFSGRVRVYRYVYGGLMHSRTIVKTKGAPVWKVTDEMSGTMGDLAMRQIWHYDSRNRGQLSLDATNANGEALTPQTHEGWNSSFYGQKTKNEMVCFSDKGSKKIATIIKVV